MCFQVTHLSHSTGQELKVQGIRGLGMISEDWGG